MSILFLILATVLVLSVTAMAVAGAAGRKRFLWTVAVIFIVLVVGNYVFLGRPDLTRPRAASLDTLQARAMAKMDETAAILERSPNASLENWTELANQYWAMGRPDKAAGALGNAAAIAPTPTERDGFLGGQAQALVTANNRQVGDQALALFSGILERNPNDLRALFFLGLAAEQAGDKGTMQTYWGRIIEIAPEDTPWRKTLEARIGQIGQSPSPQKAIAGLSADERTMVAGMVARLATRLENEGGSAADWAKLGKSYTVLGKNEAAIEAYDKAIALAPDDAAYQSARSALTDTP